MGRGFISIKDRRGFSLVETMFVTGIVLISGMALATFSNSAASFEKQMKARSGLLQVRAEVVSYLSKQDAWAYTVSTVNESRNPDLACIRDGVACTPGTYPLSLYRVDGTVLIDSGNPQAGFTSDGVACSTFVQSESPGTSPSGSLSTSGEDQSVTTCKYRFNVSWSPICPTTGDCTRPQVAVKVRMLASSQDINVNSMNLQMDALIEQPTSLPAVVPNQTLMTNADFIYPSSSTVNFNPLTASGVTAGRFEIVPFDLSSAFGGRVKSTVGDSTAADAAFYKPQASFYGVDSFSIPLRDKVTGKVVSAKYQVKVMTPYTWTGKAASATPPDKTTNGPDMTTNDIEPIVDPAMTADTAANFCGKVVSGVCDGATFPEEAPNVTYRHLVFDDTCSSNCDAILNSKLIGVAVSASKTYKFQAASIELAKTYRGTVTLNENAQFIDNYGTWIKPNITVAGGTLNANGKNLKADDSTRQTPYVFGRDFALRVSGSGRLIAGADVSITGDAHIAGPANFVPGASRFTISSIGRVSQLTAPGVEFNRLTIGIPGGSSRGTVDIGSNLRTAFLDFNPTDSNDRISNGRDVATGLYLASKPIVSVTGSVSTDADASGGAQCAPVAVNECLGAVIELNGTSDQAFNGKPIAKLAGAVSQANARLVTTFPSIRINKTSGRVSFTNLVAVRDSFEVLASGDGIDWDAAAAKSALLFNSTSCGESILNLAQPMVVNDLYEIMTGCPANLNLSASAVTVNNNFYHAATSGSRLYGDEGKGAVVDVKGDFVIGGLHANGMLDRAVTVRMVGDGDQNIRPMDPTAPSIMITKVIIQKYSGILTMKGQIGTIASSFWSLTQSSARLQHEAGSTFYTAVHSGIADRTLITIDGNFDPFENLEFGHGTDLGSNLSTKNLTIGAPASISGLDGRGNKITVMGDVNLVKSFGGTGYIEISGSIPQNIFGAVGPLVSSDPANQLADIDRAADFGKYKIRVNKSANDANFNGYLKVDRLCLDSIKSVMLPGAKLFTTALDYGPAFGFTPTPETYITTAGSLGYSANTMGPCLPEGSSGPPGPKKM